VVVRPLRLHRRPFVHLLRLSTTSAAILLAQRDALVVDEVELPSELRFGQVLVRVAFSGVCGSQLGEIDGVKGPDPYLPHLLGHEGGGIVEAVGEGVTTVSVDDHVVLHWRVGAGLRSGTPTYRWDGRRVNAGWVTTFNQRAVVSEDRVTAIPRDFPLDLAPLLGCAVTTGLGAITRDAAVTPGESVVVLGAGGVGLSAVQAAALVSAVPIVAVDMHENRLRLARQVGATHVVHAADAAGEDEIRVLLGDDGADACIETSGDPRAIERAIGLTGTRGRVVLVGVPSRADAIALHTLQLHFGKRLIGSHGGQAQPAEDIPRLVRLIEAGRLDLSPLVGDRVPLEKVNQAIERIRSGRAAGRILLEL